MEQYPSDNFIPQREPNEVTLEYVAEPKPYVAYYVQDRPLPGRKPETAAQEPPAKTRRKGHRGLKIFLICLAAVLVLAGGLYAVWWFGLLPDRFYGGDHGDYYDDPGYYYYYGELDESAEPELPVVSADDGVRLVYADGHGDALTIQEIYRRVNPSTVTVVTELPRGASVGTGVILTEDGYIITNAHVIAGGTSCYVALADGSIFDAALVGYDAEQDLAVIKAQDTDGIVSAINRDVDVDGVTMTLIQTNAALNNGNSGGPLINRYGQVIGINVMKMGMDRWSTASVEGLGFAIPIASSAYIVNDILRCGEVQGEPVLGISVDRTPAYLPDGQQAARVYTVDLNGPGDKAGLEVDDLIYEADGVRVETSNDLLRVRHRHAAGEEMILKVCRGGEYLTVSVTLEAKK